MPIGMQLIGRHCEEGLLRTGMALQAATDWHRHRPLQ
jgi:Asp-tRNA(Asn)/Glu-tRNA(Gln) amidotransferase A subunit family amidase